MTSRRIENSAENPGALVIDGHGRADLGVVRSLGERGVPVYLATDSPANAVCHSRFVTRVFPFPSPRAPDARKVEALAALGRRFAHRPVFFSTGDTSLLFFSRHRAALEAHFRHHVGDPWLMEALNDKRRFAALAEKHGLPVPGSLAPVSRGDLAARLGSLRFPVMVKPAEKRNWEPYPEVARVVGGNLKGVKVATPEALLRLYDDLTPYDNRVVVQDYIEGRDEEIWSVHAFIDRHGEVKAWFTGRKVRTWPIHRGIGCFVASVIDHDVQRVGVEALQRMGYTGHADVQIKRAPDTGRFLIIEVNCRYNTWNDLHTAAGVNQPYLAYLDSLGRDVPPAPEQTEGVRWIDPAKDIRALREYRRVREWTFLQWLGTYPGRNRYAFFAWNDPMPWLVPALRRYPSLAVRAVRVLKRGLRRPRKPPPLPSCRT
jgi:D-aspartate ligase